MNQYIAKKAELELKQECSDRACGCFTDSGYYVKYANRNVDGVLFVCDECFDKKYKSICLIKNFQTKSSRTDTMKRELDNPTIRKIIRIFNRIIPCIRYVLICFFVICTILIMASSNNYKLRPLSLPQAKIVKVASALNERLEGITERIQYVFEEERK